MLGWKPVGHYSFPFLPLRAAPSTRGNPIIPAQTISNVGRSGSPLIGMNSSCKNPRAPSAKSSTSLVMRPGGMALIVVVPSAFQYPANGLQADLQGFDSGGDLVLEADLLGLLPVHEPPEGMQVHLDGAIAGEQSLR